MTRQYLERKNLEIKSMDDQGFFSGYASIFDVVDSQNDMIVKGAFQRTLRDHKGDIKLLWQHRFEEPIGIFTRMEEDVHGLYVEGRLLLEVQRAREAHALLKSGSVGGLSIGYMPVKYHMDAATGVRVLEEVALYEVSLVTFPANEHAKVRTVKQNGKTQEALDRKEDYTAQIRQGDFIRLADELDRALAILTTTSGF